MCPVNAAQAVSSVSDCQPVLDSNECSCGVNHPMVMHSKKTRHRIWILCGILSSVVASSGELPPPFPTDPQQYLERTCFQTGQAWSGLGNLRSDVAIVYGVDPGLPQRIQTWRDRGYRIHVMTGVSWGNYQDYLYGRFDGSNHVDEAQTDRKGQKISHGGDVYYMCPGENFGKFLSIGVQRALDAGAEAVHLEEPEFWVRGGYSEGFKREWRNYYQQEWQPPHESADTQWRASKLKYYLYGRALQQVFDHVQQFNQRTGRRVRCYVPTHSLLNYAHWRIVSPESSLARLRGCDGYIAQVWTGTSRTPNLYRGQLRERTFETAFLEYGAMQNLVRATGRTVWYLNDPVEDNPAHDWEDYRVNWESTMVASLLQPEVWRFEVAPWPERVFGGRYPNKFQSSVREPMPPAYATEVQTVINTLHDMAQGRVAWESSGLGIGVLVSDSLMFQRGDPHSSDNHLSHFYGLAMPLLKRGIAATPVQLENLVLPRYLDGFRILFLSYHGMKPLSPEPHPILANWIRQGGVLVVCDDDTDPYCSVREWWNTNGLSYATPRQHLFSCFNLPPSHSIMPGQPIPMGKGALIWMTQNPARLASDPQGDQVVINAARQAAHLLRLPWHETNYLMLRRGPYVIAAGLDESIAAPPHALNGRWINLFDPQLRVLDCVVLDPSSRHFLLDLTAVRGLRPRVLASACKTLSLGTNRRKLRLAVEGVSQTPAVVLIHAANPPRAIELDSHPAFDFEYSRSNQLLWIRFPNEAKPRELTIRF